MDSRIILDLRRSYWDVSLGAMNSESRRLFLL